MAHPRHFIIAGTEKAGTTSVFVYLAEHPEVCASVRKETDFFRRIGVNGSLSRDDYEQRFAHCATADTIRMEASPGYLGEAETVAPRMVALLPDAQLLFILRNPVERLHSSYHFHVGRLNIDESISFRTYVDKCLAYDSGAASARELGLDPWYLDVLRYGRYSDLLKIYLASFPPANIRVMFFEDLRDDPQAFMCDLCDFLGIDAAFWDNFEFRRENVTFSAGNKPLHRLALDINSRAEPYLRRLPRLKRKLVSLYKGVNQVGEGYAEMADEDRTRLQAYYAPANNALSELLGRSVPSSWRSAARRTGVRRSAAEMPHAGSRTAFIVGAGRSGTTLLYKLLCLHREVGFISNYDNRLRGLAPGLMLRLFRHAPRAKLAAWFGRSGAAYLVRRRALMRLVPSPVEGEDLFRACGISRASAPAADIAPAAFTQLRRRLERIGAGAGTQVMLCKRTATNRFIDSLDAAMPGSRYIHLIRDGRDVANSLSKVDWWSRHIVWWDGRTAGEMEEAGEPRLSVCARNWVAEVEAIQRGLAGVETARVLEIRYEDLLERPVPVLGSVLEFLGLQLDNEMSQSVALLALRRRSPGGPSGWSERERALVRSETGPLLTRFGYLKADKGESS